MQQIWILMGHCVEEATETVALLPTVGISPYGHFGKHSVVSGILQAGSGVMRLSGFIKWAHFILMTADKSHKIWPQNNFRNWTEKKDGGISISECLIILVPDFQCMNA